MGAPVDDDGDVSARRTLAFFVVALLTLAAGVVVTLLDEDADDPARSAPAGPAPGTDVASYLQDRRERLTEVEGVREAVVSFDRYRTRDEAESLLEATEVSAFLVALPRDEPRVTTDIAGLRASVRTIAEEQIAEIEPLVPTVDDPAFAEFYRAELLRYRAILSGSSTPDVVFGAVVRAPASRLRALASRPGVRLVDLAPGPAGPVDASRVRGLRPEETLSAGRPRFRP